MTTRMFPVLRLKQEAYDQLLLVARDNPEVYMRPETDFGEILARRGITAYAEDTGISFDSTIDLIPVSTAPRHRADKQAIAFYRSLIGMTPQAATDPLMWTWMTHFKLHAYGIERWPIYSTKLTNHIKAHWFVGNEADALRQNNTAGRTWWIAHTAIMAAGSSGGAFSERDAIEHFATYPRHYHNMMDSNFSRHPLICAELVRALLTDAKGVSGIGSDQIW